MTHQQMAVYIAERSRASKIAAFVIDGKVRTFVLLSEDSEYRLNRMLRDLPDKFLAVYHDVDPNWVLDDIKHAMKLS